MREGERARGHLPGWIMQGGGVYIIASGRRTRRKKNGGRGGGKTREGGEEGCGEAQAMEVGKGEMREGMGSNVRARRSDERPNDARVRGGPHNMARDEQEIWGWQGAGVGGVVRGGG